MDKCDAWDFSHGPLVAVPRELTAAERFRLIEIAHETRDSEIRKRALELLRSISVPVSS